MTSVRSSMVFSLESDFGEGKGSGYEWIAPPPGTYFEHTESRNTTRVQSAGTKVWDTVAYGNLNGTWTWHFVLDYNYLEPLFLIFEGTAPAAGTPITVGDVTSYKYDFTKVDYARVPSFCVRRVILNRMAGGLRSSPGGLDEILYLKGCIIENVTFSRASGQSQMTVDMSGFYVDSQMEKGVLGRTDYQPYAGNLTEYTCLFIGDASDDDIQDLDEDDYVANTETLSFTINNSAEAIFNVCTPFAKEYSEGLSKYSFSTTAYSNDPSHYQQRVFSGGYSNTALKPMIKGLAPIPYMYILAYDQEINTEHPTHLAAYNASPKRVGITIKSCVIRSLPWKSGDSEKLQDVISSTECKQVLMECVSPSADFSFTSSDTNAIAPENMAIFSTPASSEENEGSDDGDGNQ